MIVCKRRRQIKKVKLHNEQMKVNVKGKKMRY